MNVAIIGLGKMGKYHYKACKEMGHNVFHCDTNIKLLGYDGYADYKQIPLHIDAVIIATPTPTHFEIASYFIACGVNTFIEKPMCETSLDAYYLVEQAKRKNVQLMVGHIERFNPAIDDGRFTDTTNIRDITTIRRGYTPSAISNIVSDVMIHDIDTVMQILGCKVLPSVYTSITKGRNFSIATLDYNGIPVTHIVDRKSKHIIREIRVATDTHYYIMDMQNKRFTIYNDVDKESCYSIQSNTDALRKELSAFFDGYNNALQSATNVEICEDIVRGSIRWKKE
jgi:predicted dehydrogenase